MKCRHCKVRTANRPRGLCWPCYYTPGIRERYPGDTRQRRGEGIDNHIGHTPARPTGAAPGTKAKVSILERRAKRGEALWHPADFEVSLN